MRFALLAATLAACRPAAWAQSIVAIEGRNIRVEFDDALRGRVTAAGSGKFFAAEWNGPLELRGLGNRRYRVTDYVEGNDLGTVRGPTASLNAAFTGHLLLEARPE
jgi:hypothetical protein